MSPRTTRAVGGCLGRLVEGGLSWLIWQRAPLGKWDGVLAVAFLLATESNRTLYMIWGILNRQEESGKPTPTAKPQGG